METLANLESFVRSAECGSFSAAARRLALTPAAVSRNVAMLERNLGVRLFHRSTRKLTLTEAGEAFLAAIGNPLQSLHDAIQSIAHDDGQPAGVLKISVAPAFGMDWLMPLLPEFLQRYPRVQPEWHFENRAVDLVAEGYDAAIGGGFELTPGVVARAVAPVHVIAVASPAYLAARPPLTDPTGLIAMDGIALRSQTSGRIRTWTMRNAQGDEAVAALRETIVLTDAAAVREAVRMNLGVGLVAVCDVQPCLARGELVRVLPDWWADAGVISLYYASRDLLPGKTRAFVDFVVETYAREQYMQRFSANPAP